MGGQFQIYPGEVTGNNDLCNCILPNPFECKFKRFSPISKHVGKGNTSSRHSCPEYYLSTVAILLFSFSFLSSAHLTESSTKRVSQEGKKDR